MSTKRKLKSNARRRRAKGVSKVKQGQNAPLLSMGGKPRKNYTAKPGTRPRTTKDAQMMMETNAMVYTASLMQPFEVRGARIPDSTPFPSTTGSSIMRYQPAQITDSGDASEWTGMYFGLDPTNGGTWTAEIATVASGVESWATSEHPHQPEFATNFGYIRTVSMGIRVINVGMLVARGGAFYVSYSTAAPSGNLIADLLLADETEVYDAARMEEEGLSAVYLPMSRGPVQNGAGNLDATGGVYINPALTITNKVHDTGIFIWAKSADSGADLSLEIEQVHNWEAIPHPANQYLFDRKSVVGSESANAAAREISSTPAVTTSVSHSGSLADHASNSAGKVLKHGISQIESIAMKGLSMLPGLLFSLLDVRKHRLAVSLELAQELSPMVNPKMKKLAWDDFVTLGMKLLIQRRKRGKKQKEEKTKEKDLENFELVE